MDACFPHTHLAQPCNDTLCAICSSPEVCDLCQPGTVPDATGACLPQTNEGAADVPAPTSTGPVSAAPAGASPTATDGADPAGASLTGASRKSCPEVSWGGAWCAPLLGRKLASSRCHKPAWGRAQAPAALPGHWHLLAASCSVIPLTCLATLFSLQGQYWNGWNPDGTAVCLDCKRGRRREGGGPGRRGITGRSARIRTAIPLLLPCAAQATAPAAATAHSATPRSSALTSVGAPGGSGRWGF